MFRVRKDLYYRLNVMNINVPSLRERKEVKGVAGEAMKDLLGYHWPGNVREMKNMFEY